MIHKFGVAKHGFSIIARVFAVLVCLILSLSVLSVVGITYASGFGFYESDPHRNPETDLNFVDFNKPNSDETENLRETSKRDVSDLVGEIKSEEEARAKAEAEAKRAREAASIANANTNKQTAGSPNDGVDFSIGEEAFVKLWGARIDAYLSGSPLSGQGKTFAKAAFDYGVDPRVSPAISNTESSKGAICFRPHNAWGWGSSSWSSWEEAINAHVKGFANGYGYTVTLAGAKAYCPPNWSHWYSSTTAQMALI